MEITPNFVISTGAKRSGEICGFPHLAQRARQIWGTPRLWRFWIHTSSRSTVPHPCIAGVPGKRSLLEWVARVGGHKSNRSGASLEYDTLAQNRSVRLLALLAGLLLCGPALAQTLLPELPTLPLFPLHPQQTPIISSNAVVSRPFSVVGPRGAVLGEQDGSVPRSGSFPGRS